MRVSERLLLLVGPAVALASVDLVVKATVPTAAWAYHHRSGAWVALCVALLVSSAFLCVVPSASVAVAGGVMSAGVLGNLVSARADGNWVPNPLTVSPGRFTVAFNLADVFFLLGNLMLMVALSTEVVRRRGRLAPALGRGPLTGGQD
jgi:lipoprotein signal peptidase